MLFFGNAKNTWQILSRKCHPKGSLKSIRISNKKIRKKASLIHFENPKDAEFKPQNFPGLEQRTESTPNCLIASLKSDNGNHILQNQDCGFSLRPFDQLPADPVPPIIPSAIDLTTSWDKNHPSQNFNPILNLPTLPDDRTDDQYLPAQTGVFLFQSNSSASIRPSLLENLVSHLDLNNQLLTMLNTKQHVSRPLAQTMQPEIHQELGQSYFQSKLQVNKENPKFNFRFAQRPTDLMFQTEASPYSIPPPYIPYSKQMFFTQPSNNYYINNMSIQSNRMTCCHCCRETQQGFFYESFRSPGYVLIPPKPHPWNPSLGNHCETKRDQLFNVSLRVFMQPESETLFEIKPRDLLVNQSDRPDSMHPNILPK